VRPLVAVVLVAVAAIATATAAVAVASASPNRFNGKLDEKVEARLVDDVVGVRGNRAGLVDWLEQSNDRLK
jgi:hypothetical protein